MATTTDFLAFGCKRSDHLDITKPISKYVGKIYGKEQAADILQDIEEVTRRRREVVAASGGGASEGAKEICASYYRALSVMETRFPISRDSNHAQVVFCWTNAMNPRKRCKQLNIHFEKASVLFNIAAHLSQSAAQQNRESSSAYKEAMKNFQEAATVFAQVRDVALKVENPKPSDLTADFLMMAEKLMLAQGHECVYWIASKDQKSPLILARVAKQASGIYAEALGFLANPFVREDLDKLWQDLVQSKSWLFEALCQYHAAEDARSKEDISTEISRLNQTTMLLQKLLKNGKFMTQSLPILLKELTATVTKRLQKAEGDNASVYLKRVHPFNELPLITGVSLVKPSPCAYLDASSEHIFSDLIPEPITKALSRYSDLVDEIIRKQMAKLDGATDEARLRLKQYELPERLDSVTSTNPAMIPEGLKKDLEEIEQCGGIGYLVEMVAQVTGLKNSAVADLDKVEQDLDDEATKDSECREQYGQQWTAKTSAGQTVGFRKIVSSYRENITNADNSDRVIQEKLTQNTEKLGLLSLTSCAEHLPKLEAGMVNTTDLEPQTILANLKNAVDQLGAMSEERAGLEESLKEMKNKDNLLPKLVATGVGSHEELFKMELLKYDELIKDVDENLKNQAELLEYVRKALGTFEQTFDITAWKQKTDQYCKEIKANIAAFHDIRTNLGEGMRFYMDLKAHVDKLKQQTTDFILSRTLDREDRLEMLKAKEKPAVMVAPPQPPAEPPAFVPPPSVPSEPSTYATSPPQPTQVSTASYTTPSYAGVPMETRQDSGTQKPMAPAAPPPPPDPPGSTYVPQAPPTAPPVQHDAMVESPNPYYPPPPQSHHPPSPPPPSAQHSSFYNPYVPQGHYPPSQAAYSPNTTHSIPPNPGYSNQGQTAQTPMSYAHPGSGQPAPQYAHPGSGQPAPQYAHPGSGQPAPQYHQPNYQQNYQHSYQPNQPASYPYPPQDQPMQHPYPPQDQQMQHPYPQQQGQQPPPPSGYSQYPPGPHYPYQHH